MGKRTYGVVETKMPHHQLRAFIPSIMNIRQPYSCAQIEDTSKRLSLRSNWRSSNQLDMLQTNLKSLSQLLLIRYLGRKRCSSRDGTCSSKGEENTLARWIIRLSATDFSATHMLIKEKGEEARARRGQIASSQTTLRTNPTPKGHEWIYRF